jgi:hypothetical protein
MSHKNPLFVKRLLMVDEQTENIPEGALGAVLLWKSMMGIGESGDVARGWD